MNMKPGPRPCRLSPARLRRNKSPFARFRSLGIGTCGQTAQAGSIPSSANCHRVAANTQGLTGKYPTYRELRDFTAKSSIVTFGARLPTVRRVGKRAGGVLVASIAALTGCSGPGSTAAPSETTSRSAATTSTAAKPTTTVRPQATTTTTVPEFSFDDSVPPPKLVNTGTNYPAILESLEAYGNWTVAHHPDATLTDRFVARGTALSRAYLDILASLSNKHQRGVEVLGGPSRYTIISATQDAVSARVVEDIDAHRVVDSSSHVVREQRFSGSTTYLDLVVLVGEHWVLASSRVIVAPEEIP